MSAHCHTCNRALVAGEVVWASDWKVIDIGGTHADLRTETRYTCGDCDVAT